MFVILTCGFAKLLIWSRFHYDLHKTRLWHVDLLITSHVNLAFWLEDFGHKDVIDVNIRLFLMYLCKQKMYLKRKDPRVASYLLFSTCSFNIFILAFSIGDSKMNDDLRIFFVIISLKISSYCLINKVDSLYWASW